MIRKIFFFLMLVIMVYGFLSKLNYGYQLVSVNSLSFIFVMIELAAFYSYAFKKKLFSTKFWRIFFAVDLVYTAIILVLQNPLFGQTAQFLSYSQAPIQSQTSYIAALGFFIFLKLPFYYALYMIGFKKGLL